MSNLELTINGASMGLDVRRVEVREAISELFEVKVEALCEDPNLALEGAVGADALLRIRAAEPGAGSASWVAWSGICARVALVRSTADGASTYQFTIVPTLARLAKRTNYRLFQHLSIPEIIDRLLHEWGIEPAWRLDFDGYAPLELRVQYGESDYAFVRRLMEECGITFFFERGEDTTTLVIGDAPARTGGRLERPLHAVDSPMRVSDRPIAERVHLAHELVSGASVFIDYDLRNPAFDLRVPGHNRGDTRLEVARYEPGSMLVEGEQGGGSPVGDDLGVARHTRAAGGRRAACAAAAAAGSAHVVSFRTNELRAAPGALLHITDHPYDELAARTLLATRFELSLDHDGDWLADCAAVHARDDYHPGASTPKPAVHGVVTARVVGPAGQDIHTDELARVRVQFPWDREGTNDEHASCWLRVSQGWAGAGYGFVTIPRVGHEVLVAFLGGNPDQPIVVGRVHNATQTVPYKLPEHKTKSTWRSASSPGGGGFNEIMFEDAAGHELMYLHAQRDRDARVEHDDRLRVVRDRDKEVGRDEIERVKGKRVENVDGSRSESTGAQRSIYTASHHDLRVGASYTRRVTGDDVMRVAGRRQLTCDSEEHVLVKATARRKVASDRHLLVCGKSNEKVDGTRSIIVGEDQHASVGGLWALEAGDEIHMKAKQNLVIECETDISIIGPGGFIRIDQSGVVIQGKVVKINSGGSAGSGNGSFPEEPEEPEEVGDEEQAEEHEDEAEEERDDDPPAPPPARSDATR
jgi:type VI secretion system secreted protein VgrG